jgi:hypothetical protein
MSQNNIIYQIHCSTPLNKNNINLLLIQLAAVWFPIISSKVRTLECGHKHLVLLSPPASSAARSHPPLTLPRVPIDQCVAPRSMALWEWEHMHMMKEPMPQTKVFIPYKHEDNIITHRMNPPLDRLVG